MEEHNRNRYNAQCIHCPERLNESGAFNTSKNTKIMKMYNVYCTPVSFLGQEICPTHVFIPGTKHHTWLVIGLQKPKSK